MIAMIGGYDFQNPEFFVLLALIPIIGAWFWWNKKPYEPSITISDVSDFIDDQNWRGKARIILPILRTLAVITLIVAIARPQLTLKEEEITELLFTTYVQYTLGDSIERHLEKSC